MRESLASQLNKNSYRTIQVNTFIIESSNNILHLDRLNKYINGFLSKNEVKVVNINKYNMAIGGDNGLCAFPTAMLIYKTKE